MKDLLEPVVEAAGFKPVRLRLMGGPVPTLQIMAEHPDGSMDVEGCAKLSRAITDFLEANPVEDDFLIEVSSPGIDRPLTRLSDFSRWSGHEAKIELGAAIPTLQGERKRFKGTLAGIDGNQVLLATGTEKIQFPFPAILEAKLVLTDKLISQDLKARKSA